MTRRAAAGGEAGLRSAFLIEGMARVGVLLLNLGGPERIEDVGPFLYNLLADPEIIRLPTPALQKPLAWLISTLRSGK